MEKRAIHETVTILQYFAQNVVNGLGTRRHKRATSAGDCVGGLKQLKYLYNRGYKNTRVLEDVTGEANMNFYVDKTRNTLHFRMGEAGPCPCGWSPYHQDPHDVFDGISHLMIVATLVQRGPPEINKFLLAATWCDKCQASLSKYTEYLQAIIDKDKGEQ